MWIRDRIHLNEHNCIVVGRQEFAMQVSNARSKENCN